MKFTRERGGEEFLGVTTAGRRAKPDDDIASMSRMTGDVALQAPGPVFEGALLVKRKSRLLRGSDLEPKVRPQRPSLRLAMRFFRIADCGLWSHMY